MSRLEKKKCYLCGPIDEAVDVGRGWRQAITPHLENRGVVVSDPTNFSFKTNAETEQVVAHHHYLKANKKYSKLSKGMKLHRAIDLLEIEQSDFVIAYLDKTIPTCGSWEEIFWANRLKRPIIVWAANGKRELPNWMFGALNHKLFFSHLGKIIKYLDHINDPATKDYDKRWHFSD